jgi:hypothetical protein
MTMSKVKSSKTHVNWSEKSVTGPGVGSKTERYAGGGFVKGMAKGMSRLNPDDQAVASYNKNRRRISDPSDISPDYGYSEDRESDLTLQTPPQRTSRRK